MLAGDSVDAISLSCTSHNLWGVASHAGVLERAICGIAWAHHLLNNYAYFSATDGCIHPMSHLVSLREASRMSAYKNERGLRRAVTRAHCNNALLLRHMSVGQALRMALQPRRRRDRG